MHDPVVRKDPDTSIPVFFYLINGPVTEQGVVVLLEVVSVECIQPVGRADPDLSVLFLEYTVHGRGEAIVLRNAGVDELLFRICRDGGYDYRRDRDE